MSYTAWGFLDHPDYTETTMVKCPLCSEPSRLSEWIFDWDCVDCEICRSHCGIICPNCCGGFDNRPMGELEIVAQ